MDAKTACDSSIVYAMTVMAGWCEARVREDGDALFVVGKSRFPTSFTNALFAKREPDADALLDRAGALFSDRRYMTWGQESLSEFFVRAAMRGHTVLSPTPGMVIEARVEPPAPSVDAGLLRAEEFDEWVQVLAASYAEMGLLPRATPALLGERERTLPTGAFALARVDGVAAAAALSLTDPRTRVGGVYWVGTTPHARRRGAGDAVTRLVTNASFDAGADIVTLQASSAGAPVYARMGFREVCRYARTLSPPLA